MSRAPMSERRASKRDPLSSASGARAARPARGAHTPDGGRAAWPTIDDLTPITS